MAIKLIEGFELNAATTAATAQYYHRKYEAVDGTPNVGGGFQLGSSLSSNSFRFSTPEFADHATWVVHWVMRTGSIGTGSVNVGVILQRADTEQFRVVLRSFTGAAGSDRFYVDLKRGATTVATAGPFWTDKWYTYELEVTVHPTTGTYDLRMDGVSVLSDTGVNTADAGVADADRVRFDCRTGTSGGNTLLDHVLVADGSGSGVTGLPGELLVVHALPNADGDDLEWTPSTGSSHFVLVNEAMPAANVIATLDPNLISSVSIGDLDRWTMANIASLGIPSGATILGVEVETSASMGGSGSRDLRVLFKDTTAATAEGDSFTVDTTEWDVYSQIWETNPATAVAWTVATLDAGQFGVKVQA